MVAPCTKHLWVGFLDPNLTDEEIPKDVAEWLSDLEIDRISPEHESLRRAARVVLKKYISKDAVWELGRRPYHGKYTICVDDCQPQNPAHTSQVCPRYKGVSKFCRWANIRYAGNPCDFQHPPRMSPTIRAEYWMEDVPLRSAKGEELVSHFMQSAPFHNGTPRVVGIQSISNPILHERYEARKRYQDSKHSTAGTECELYHGTNCNILPIVYQHGLKVPSDFMADDRCPVSGGKGLSTSLCNNDCKFCTQPHQWNRCHMYGLGIYLADMAAKSHRYVSQPLHGRYYKIVKCRAALGNPYLVEGHLKKQDAMHDHIFCAPVENKIAPITKGQAWAREDNDTYYVKGLGGAARPGASVVNSEYICFVPWQVLPVYEITYELC
eukprot:TRINITY_DN67602_c5_g1_i1.p1 TRINITY_DN67602_c5_g1~~TRINITY_DN67602_c5_g1_i1.p1  ORF type:complete len:381 (-),score=21.92 TRINITY_DN67602_c5_g1_i1:426-1568(-)